jgi:hypothetical protein
MGGLPRRYARLSTTGNPNWGTPDWILEKAREFCGGQIALDPCGRPGSLVNAFLEFHGPHSRGKHRQDGLTSAWKVAACCVEADFMLAWVNPPYTRGVIDLWVARARAKASAELDVCAIVPLRPSSLWFREHCLPPSASVCMLDRRVKFDGAPSGATWETAIVHWGEYTKWFAETFGKIGKVWTTDA